MLLLAFYTAPTIGYVQYNYIPILQCTTVYRTLSTTAAADETKVKGGLHAHGSIIKIEKCGRLAGGSLDYTFKQPCTPLVDAKVSK